MPSRATACAHCDPNQKPPLCCGVCVFEGRRCDAYYPQEGRSEAVAQHLLDSGYRLKVGCNHDWVGGTRMAEASVGCCCHTLMQMCTVQPADSNHAAVSSCLSGMPSLSSPCPQDLSPCELFARIRGRTLWFMGDSQTW